MKVSALSFGSWATFGNQLDVDEAETCMVASYDAGVNFFDNAEAYLLLAIDLVDQLDASVIDKIEMILDNKPEQPEF